MKSPLLRSIPAADIPATRYDPVDEATLARAGEIVRDVREHGRDALERYAHQLDRLGEDQPLIVDQAELQDVLEIVSAEDLALLERTAKRIERFARAQLDALREISVPVDGGQAGHRIFPLATAGCYAPGGRFPLPSTVLMTAVTARVAGVKEVWGGFTVAGSDHACSGGDRESQWRGARRWGSGHRGVCVWSRFDPGLRCNCRPWESLGDRGQADRRWTGGD
jgi:hypothetical protein